MSKSLMEYRTVEAILADLHNIRPEALGAFRSRLRVLRDMGVPNVSRPGKGARVAYELYDLWEAHLGLHLETFGLPPSRVRFVVEEARVGDWFNDARVRENSTRGDAWARISLSDLHQGAKPDKARGFGDIQHISEHAEFLTFTETTPMPAMMMGLIDLSKITREIEAAVQRHVKRKQER